MKISRYTLPLHGLLLSMGVQAFELASPDIADGQPLT